MSTAWMQRAIALAMTGRGRVEPNPMVGCVLVREDAVIGEGRHEYFGGPHAEPNALASCKQSPKGATAYVTLEPCCHTNKKTPPCVPRLVAAGISRVVVGCLDVNTDVSGKGVAQLREAGIAVDVGMLEAECKQLNAAYMAGVLHHRPYVTLKWAQSADGKVAGPGGRRRTISNSASLRAMHALRDRCDAILVGIRTVERDDPLLTARGVEPSRPLLRVVLDSDLRLSPESQLARTADVSPVLRYCSDRAVEQPGGRITTIPVASAGGRLSLPAVLTDLHHRGVTHLLVEPGPGLARTFFAANLADRVWVVRSLNSIGDESAPAAETVSFPAAAEVNLEGDVLSEYLNPTSAVYFAPEVSADLVLTQQRPGNKFPGRC
jgi:diaminohydroxyphosphoribosylaminopyrimidine deaminase/5-amino-6-(5-phosphoribosylamino)uracil reductase